MEEQSATLRRALDALNSICRRKPAGNTRHADPEAPTQLPSTPTPGDADAFREPFGRWLDSACALRPRAFGSVKELHLAYCEWETAQAGVPSGREMFERLLRERGFLIGEVEGTMLVSGLALRVDVETTGLLPAGPVL
jgi:hypothetical protein